MPVQLFSTRIFHAPVSSVFAVICACLFPIILLCYKKCTRVVFAIHGSITQCAAPADETDVQRVYEGGGTLDIDFLQFSGYMHVLVHARVRRPACTWPDRSIHTSMRVTGNIISLMCCMQFACFLSTRELKHVGSGVDH